MAIPEGFLPIPTYSTYFDKIIGPFYLKKQDDKFTVGMITSERHMRGKGFVAGLVTATLADFAMGYVVARRLWPETEDLSKNQIKLVTVSLNVDFVASPPVGAWLEVETEVVKTGRVCFAQSITRFSDRIMMRANASFIVRE